MMWILFLEIRVYGAYHGIQTSQQKQACQTKNCGGDYRVDHYNHYIGGGTLLVVFLRFFLAIVGFLGGTNSQAVARPEYRLDETLLQTIVRLPDEKALRHRLQKHLGGRTEIFLQQSKLLEGLAGQDKSFQDIISAVYDSGSSIQLSATRKTEVMNDIILLIIQDHSELEAQFKIIVVLEEMGLLRLTERIPKP
ncbi:MAG: hypothetical protein WCG05_04470 [Alphaproteobacteria bacterium]